MTGASPDGDRATHEPSPSVSAVPVGVPSAVTSRFETGLAQSLERFLLLELQDRGTVRSLAAIYALLMAAEMQTDGVRAPFEPVNRAIIAAHGVERLRRIKALAWRAYERTARRGDAAVVTECFTVEPANRFGAEYLWLQFSDDGQHIRRWSRERFDEGECFATANAMHRAEDTVSAFTECLTPSTENKRAYMGEFSFSVPDFDDCGGRTMRHVDVPWTTIKQIMLAIRDRALWEAANPLPPASNPFSFYTRFDERVPAQGIAARSDETPQAAQPEGQEPGPEGMRP